MAPPSIHPDHPASSASLRPSSSASTQRPSSSLSARPRSSSSLSTSRPQSRATRRPSSRHGHRLRLQPLAQNLVTQIVGLREGANPHDPNGEKFKTSVEYAVKRLEATTLNKGAASVDMRAIDQQIHGYAFKARINSDDALSEALLIAYRRVKASVAGNHDFDQGIKMYRLPDHLQLLIQLSQPPSAQTLAYAENYVDEAKNPPPAPKPLTWADILAEEPFEGEHWEGVYGLPPGSIRGVSQNNATDDWDSTPSLSPLESDLELDDEDTNSLSAVGTSDIPPASGEAHDPTTDGLQVNDKEIPPYTVAHRQSLENVKAKQYWRDTWQSNVDIGKDFDLKDASTLGPTLHRLLRENAYNNRRADEATGTSLQREKYINEYDAVREVLMVLQGRSSVLYAWKDGVFTTAANTPRLAHLSLTSQNSVLTSLAQLATTIQNLREFCSRVVMHRQRQSFNKEANQQQPSRNISRTIEAFADAVDAEIRIFDQWCSAREEDMCRARGGAYTDNEHPPGLAVSLLSIEKSIRDKFGPAFDVLLGVVKHVVPELFYPQADSRRGSLRTRMKAPSVIMATLMDTLFSRAQEHIERGEDTDMLTGSVLMRVFVRAAEPVWSMIGDWLGDGMGLGLGTGVQDEGQLDDEFFIESSGLGIGIMGMGLLDPDFWKEGYSLRHNAGISVGENAEREREATMIREAKVVPLFLEHVADPVLSAGKAVGLLRALGTSQPTDSQVHWSPFSSLVSSVDPGIASEQDNSLYRRQTEKLFAVSVDTLSRLIYDNLTPRCHAAGALLAKVLVEECSLWDHLRAMEDLYFMRRGDAMSHFTDLIFSKMDAQQPWADFHFLNTAFADVVAASISTGQQRQWIRPSLVRLSYRSRDRGGSIETTVKALDGLSVDYAVPFPLAYIFQPRVVHVYCDVFIFLVQIKRAKGVLERILVRGEAARHGLKPFYAVRSRLSWFINTLLNFLTTNVIHTEVLKFHEKFRTARSLDDMIQLHEEHIDRIHSQCFLKTSTSTLHRAILSVLDMSLHFSSFFVAFAGEMTATHDVSRQSISMRRHRSRRLKRQRRNVIGFSQFLREIGDSSSSSDEDGVDLELNETKNVPETSFSMAASSISIAEGNSMEHLDKLSGELDELVRFVRRGAETLANSAGEASPTFGMFAFALEDWDL
ncbi:hypothetical protein AX17_002089 [Amanita inopinata Kibby_2008]|nr:hypothetical protein AX17_002089 [Amanita inopinata Kibby_2008]